MDIFSSWPVQSMSMYVGFFCTIYSLLTNTLHSPNYPTLILLCRRLIFSSSRHLFVIFHLTLEKLQPIVPTFLTAVLIMWRSEGGCYIDISPIHNGGCHYSFCLTYTLLMLCISTSMHYFTICPSTVIEYYEYSIYC